MIGAITGDIVGSIYEHHNIKTKAFELFQRASRFTDDTVCTVAVAHCILDKGDFSQYLRAYARHYPGRGYGGMFRNWASDPSMGPYNSWGNGAAMRVSPVAFLARDEEEVLNLAERQSSATHNHPDGIAGAQAVALTMWRLMDGINLEEIRSEITERFEYDLDLTVDEIRPTHVFDISCKGTAPVAIICALEADGYEDAVRNAISLGGDSDTLACITGGIAEARFGVPDEISTATRKYLDSDLKEVVEKFESLRNKRTSPV